MASTEHELQSNRCALDHTRIQADQQPQRVRPASCDRLASRFIFDPPLDSPFRLGYNCTLAIVTAKFGAAGRLFAPGARQSAQLLQKEEQQNRRSCWFAFLDEAAVASMSGSDVNTSAMDVAANFGSVSNLDAGDSVRPCYPLGYGLWNVILLPKTSLPLEVTTSSSSVLASRVPKMLVHCVLGYAAHALYVDAKILIPTDEPFTIWNILDNHAGPKTVYENEPQLWSQQGHNDSSRRATAPEKLSMPTVSGGVGSVPFRLPAAWIAGYHPRRKTAGQEALCVIAVGLATNATGVLAQFNHYFAEGFPNSRVSFGGPGLVEGAWHLRDLKSPDSEAIGTLWFQELLAWRHVHTRDQLSLPYVLWRLQMLPAQVAQRLSSSAQALNHLNRTSAGFLGVKRKYFESKRNNVARRGAVCKDQNMAQMPVSSVLLWEAGPKHMRQAE
uniref:Uncharacterized protein n=1 Tax=Chrysotila carterae TaxID=13221 RepID=A0A7S4ES89_CHRCT